MNKFNLLNINFGRAAIYFILFLFAFIYLAPLYVMFTTSLKDIEEIPDNIKQIYKTVWEIKQKNIIDMAADRGAFIDQTQSMNLFVSDPDPNILTKMHFYGWKKGLKTGMYYLRTRPRASTQQFTIIFKFMSVISCSQKLS